MDIGWGTAAVWMGLALLASFISIRFKLSIALVEILVGAAAGNLALLLNQNHVFGLHWSLESNEFGWRCYLGELYGSPDVPGHAAAARADDVTGLPPTLVIVGGADGFRDEDVEYALRLMRSGVATELHVLPGVPHGVQLAAGSSPAREWDDLVDGWVRRQLGA